ncbi:hybrid sensor histidine kinase/response regulator [Sphingomonas psychrotolerans]|uniref:histidine kinase n=2 Tax=Sphingomonas psychrotolerans TaxID=1327635 RepID=A0A2K8MIV9_9SPHN|nr:hybrid sensor histidine kinase/response regulator [Sphingomonas psychrotolerans]
MMREVEGQSTSGVLGSILLLDGSHLRHGAGPSLPEAYNAAIDGIPIGPAVGSCGTAAFSKAPVYVSDIGTSPLWADFRELALSHGLRACWSTPLISGSDEVLGTFAMYYREPREPVEGDLAVVDLITRTAALVIERRKSDAALRDTAERYRLVARATNDAVWDWHLADNYVLWNEALEAAYGHARADVETTGAWWIEHIHPDDRQRIDTSIHAAIDGCAENWTDEYRFLRADGGYAEVLDRGHIIRGPDGQAIRMIGAMLDLTHRRRTEAALQESEERLRLAVDNAEIGFWDVDVVNDILIWPPRTKAMFGISAAAPATMQDFYNGLHPDDRDATSAVYAAAADPDQRALYDVEYRTVGREDGIVRWVAAKGRGVFDDDGRCIRVIGTAIDITERKRLEQALRELNETLEKRVADAVAERKLLADLVEGTDAFVQVAGPDYRWLAINKAASDEFERIYGMRPQVGQSMLKVLDGYPEHRAAVAAVWGRALAGEEFTEVGEFGDESRDRRTYEMKYNVLRDSAGRQIGAYQFVYDVTERAEEQRRLAAMEEALRQAQKMEAVGQLTGGIAHDFNNMLAVVIGSLDLLGRRIGAGDPRAKRYVDAATDGARRAATLTQRLLAFSRQQPLKPETVDANKLVAGMSDLLRHSLGGDVRLETVLAGGLWRTHADPNQLENVILNLAINGRDAMPGGGRLTIETANCHLDARYTSTHLGLQAGHYVLIAVTDTGAGMPPNIIAKAFDPFFTTKEVGKGTGLGLSQVYGFVKQSGGHVKIYSEPGEGTTIKVYLPRLTGADSEHDEEQPLSDLPFGDRQEVVLVVEDEPAVRQFSVDALTELGYQVLEADGAAAALRLLDAHPEIALMFTDVVMPEVNGAKLAEEARRRRPDLRVLFTTGYTRNAVVHNGVLDPGVEMIGKPYTIEELAAKVRDVLDAPEGG